MGWFHALSFGEGRHAAGVAGGVASISYPTVFLVVYNNYFVLIRVLSLVRTPKAAF